MSDLHRMNTGRRIEAIRVLLRNHPRLAETLIAGDHALNPEATPDALDLLDTGEILVRVAWDIWNGSGESEMDMILNQLGTDDFDAVVEALRLYGQLRGRVRHAHATGSEND